jgi:uncharacterized protein (DUF1501 family)
VSDGSGRDFRRFILSKQEIPIMHTRREFLRASALVALAPAVPGFLDQIARAAAPDRDGRVLVVVQLSGGNDGINTVVPYADEGYPRLRDKLRLPTAQLKKVNDHVGLHPELGDFARLLEDGRLAIVQGVGYPNPNRSHFQSMAYWHTARLNAKDDNPDGDQFVPELVSDTGWLGRALEQAPLPSDGTPASVSVGLRPQPAALRARRTLSAALAHLDDLVLTGDANPAAALSRPESGEDVRAFTQRSLLDAYATADRLKEVAHARDAGARYPATGLAGDLRLVARLLKAGFGTRVYYVEQDGYDTHSTQLVTHGRLLSDLGGAVRAFLDDLKAAGLAERVAVLCFSEFGRRAAENGSYGTDHGTAGPVFLAGGRVKAGLVGTTPSLTDLEAGDLKMSIDFRRVYATLLDDWLGLPAKAVLGGNFEHLPLFRA